MLGKRLAKLRKDVGLTQAELAKKFNVSDGAIAMYETDKRKPDLDKLITYCNFFSVSADYLLNISNSVAENTITLPTLPKQQQKLLDTYNSLNATNQGALLERAETLLEFQNKEESTSLYAPIEGA